MTDRERLHTWLIRRTTRHIVRADMSRNICLNKLCLLCIILLGLRSTAASDDSARKNVLLLLGNIVSVFLSPRYISLAKINNSRVYCSIDKNDCYNFSYARNYSCISYTWMYFRESTIYMVHIF